MTARKLDNGEDQVYRFGYNIVGNVVYFIDPVGRTTTFLYESNPIDVNAVYQRRAGGESMDPYGEPTDLLESRTYNSGQPHLPDTITDTSGQTT